MSKETPKVAVIGTGYWGKNLVRNFHSLGALKAICDSDNTTLSHFLNDYKRVLGFNDISDILRDPEIKGVVVATPAETHANLVRQSLEAGKDVYVEKPICLSAPEGQELSDLAKEKGRILMVGHLLWYHPVVRKLKEIIDQGELGRIQYVYSNRLNMGKLRREENVLWSFAPHDISLILGLLGETPNKVQAQGGNYLHQEIADVTVSTMSFPSGVKAHIFVSWLHPYKEQKLIVVGQKKMAVFDDTADWDEKLKLYAHKVEWPGNIPVAQKAEAESIPLKQDEPLKLECQHFLNCILSGKSPQTDGDEAVRVLKVLNACQTALIEGETVKLAKLEDKKKAPADYFVHSTSEVDRKVEIGQGVKIWHFSHVMGGSRIGDKTNIGQNVVIGPNAIIGKGCKIQNNVSVYDGVVLEDDVFCGPSMVFTNVINPRSHVSRKDEYKTTLVKKGSSIGANATIVCGHTLGEYSFIGAGAVVTKDVPNHALMVGNPAQRIGWICSCGIRLGDDLTCPSCGNHYEESGQTIKRVI